MNLLQKRIAAAVKQAGSIRAAARALRVDHVYLWRLINGKKDNPGDALMRKLKLQRVVTITYKDSP